MSKDHWDAILASTPLNATAGAVTSKGYAYSPAVKVSEFEWDTPPLIIRPGRTHLNNRDFVDFTGKRFGRLTVLGMFAGDHAVNGGGALWVCRCACGRYVGRRAKAVRTASADARCQHCQHTAHLAKAASGDNARHRAESEKARKWKADATS